jgi:hypothetical protein
MVWEMATEKWLVHGHIFERLDAFAFFQFQHTVYQQERVAVWQLLQDLMDVHAHFF